MRDRQSRGGHLHPLRPLPAGPRREGGARDGGGADRRSGGHRLREGKLSPLRDPAPVRGGRSDGVAPVNGPDADPPILSWIRDQDAVARLQRAVRNDRTAQSYLFYGPRGVGKTRTALGVAQALNCTGAEPPCGACLPCRKIARLRHPDVRLLFPATKEEDSHPEEIAKRLEEYGSGRYHLLEYARNASISIDRIRELKAEAAMSLVEGRRRVFILTEAHRMQEEAAQSALKLIEEPPAGTHLILTVEEPAALLPTIVSRCQRVRFRPLRRSSIEEILVAEGGLERPAARLIGSLSEGSLGRALALREEGSKERSIVEIRDDALSLFDLEIEPTKIEERIQQQVRKWAGKLDPNTIRRNAELLLIWCHDLLAVRVGLGTESLANLDRRDRLASEAERIDLARLRAWIDALEEWVESADRNVNPGLGLHELLRRAAATDAGPPRGT
ncbi:MAG: AAA family ATPase [Candidatus Eisenbacteria bacterium]|nr:AAA family ATPase [Candidatus Latescibacterota bacterium]MBD3301555.1 AAA family ATPase [Candidatus Eisenbacteria bacterium]